MKTLFKIVLPLLTIGKLVKYTLLGILSGLLSFFFVKLVTKITGMIITGAYSRVNAGYILVFIVVIVSFIWTRRTLSLAITTLSQTLFWTIRKQILSLVLNANYRQLAVRRHKVDSAMLSDVHTLMDAAISFISFATSAILGVSCLLYMLSISVVLFLITFAVAVTGSILYHFSSDRNIRQFEQSRKLEHRFQQHYRSILDGFKEVSMAPGKGRYIFEHHIGAVAKDSYDNNMWAFTGFINNQITGQVLFYFLISTVLLCFSVSLKLAPGDTVTYVFTLLYLLGSIETIMVLLPGLARAKVAADHLMDLKTELENADLHNPIPERQMTKEEFEQITIGDLEFRYEGSIGAFGIGPLDFQLQKGETVFVYGTNGSGKTTFLYSLLGLYVPMSGEIRLNGSPVTVEGYPFYRTAFAVVFNDFYLFPEILGVDTPDGRAWNKYLRLFELEGKITLQGRQFSTTDLSAGQKKRLALIAALMEKKPVLVMDEWAADQDPYFRKKFYTEVLPVLKAEGISIIAITHDDKYYHCADKLYRMEDGRLTLVHQSNLYHVEL